MKNFKDPLDIYRFNLAKQLWKNFKNGSILFKDRSVLNIGSGRGRESHLILSEYPQYLIFSDINLNDLIFSRQSLIDFKNKFFICFDACNLPLKDRSIDIITVNETLHHLLDPSRALEEAVRVARKAVILDEPKKGELRNILDRLFIKTGIKKPYELEGDRELHFRFDIKLLSSLGEKFDLDFLFYPYFIYYFQFYKNTNLKFIRKIYKIIYALINIIFHRLGNRVIVVLKHKS